VRLGYALKRLSLAIVLIALASAALLVSDRDHRRRSAPARRVPRLAIVQHASTPVLDEGVAGMLEGLAELGYRNGDTVAITTYNAHGDLATGTAIARQVTSGDFDMVLTSSTPSMQAVANQNRAGKTMHVFGLVADPFGAGIGLDRAAPLRHPRHLIGLGSFLPVADAFQIARRALPSLKTVGVAWNPAESNSEAFTREARAVCKKMGITLLEANVESSSGVVEAIHSLGARGAQALWVGGDNTMMAALGSAIAAARAERIPVFTLTPGDPERGTAFDVGLDFRAIGRMTGVLAGRVLGGLDPAAVPIRDVVDELPRRVVINQRALQGLRESWRVPDDVAASATVLVDAKGVHEKAVATAAPALGKKWRVDLIELNNVIDVEETEAGVLEGLPAAGLVKGRDYETTIRNAQGDMATLNSLVDAALAEKTDLLITFSTPTLQAAIQRARQVPIVFTYLASPTAAGAGKSDTDHLPNVTGVYFEVAFSEMFALIRECLPHVKTLGTLFVPSEVNTVFYRDRMQEAAEKAGLSLVTVPANTSAEVADAALALTTRKIDAICQLPGNLTAAGFPSIARAAERARLPVFAFQTSQLRTGASVVVARDYYDSGRAAAALAVRVMRGERPASLPFRAMPKTRIMVNLAAARQVGLEVPPAVTSRAATVLPPQGQ
jgi:ABC-type uncharacterized transport system substrate-binding protein